MPAQAQPTMDSNCLCLGDFVANLRGPKPNLARSYLYETAAWLLIIISAGALLSVDRLISKRGQFSALALLIPAMFFCFYKLRMWAEQHAQDSVKTVLNDPRRLVLFLRPFEDDLSVNLSRLDLKSPEYLLTSLLKELGPVIAVGQPGNDTATPTVTRLYFTDDEWQDKVKALISISEIVVIQAGIYQGIEWEMATAKEMLRPHRLLISLVYLQVLTDEQRLKNEYEIFRRQFALFYKHDLPELIGDVYFIYFDDDWIPQPASTDRLGALWGMKRTIFGIRGALRPILKRHGINLSIMKWSDIESAIILGVLLSLVWFTQGWILGAFMAIGIFILLLQDRKRSLLRE